MGSIAIVRSGELHFTFFCDRGGGGGYHVHHQISQKVYKIEM